MHIERLQITLFVFLATWPSQVDFSLPSGNSQILDLPCVNYEASLGSIMVFRAPWDSLGSFGYLRVPMDSTGLLGVS